MQGAVQEQEGAAAAPSAEAEPQGSTPGGMTDDQLAAAFTDEGSGQQGAGAEGQPEGADSAKAGTQQPDPMIDLGGDVGKIPLKDVMAWREAHGKVTQEFQTVAKMRKELEPLMGVRTTLQRNRPLADAVVTLMERAGQNPAVLQRVNAILSGQPDPATTPPANPVEAKMLSMEQTIQQLQAKLDNQDADRQINSEFDELRDGNPELKALPPKEWTAIRAKIVDFMHAKGEEGFVIPANIAYSHLSKTGAVAFAKQQGQEEATLKAARDRKAPAPKAKGGTSGGAAGSAFAGKTEAEKDAELFRRLGGS